MKPFKTKLSKEQIEIFENLGAIITTSENKSFMFLPYWIEETERESIYNLHRLGDVPLELKEIIKSIRGEDVENKMQIKDSDIATVEALHDLLYDNHGYKLDHYTLTKARELTSKMYKAIGWGKDKSLK